jgi:peptide subunit release factor 1 (eRF1)
MEEIEKLKLERMLEELESYRGRHTELITVYVPADYNLNIAIKQLDTEKGTAVNIKSKNTRKSVLDALERITRQLRLYKETPKNGLAVFAGNISKTEGQEDIRVWAYEPPVPIKVKLYRCDQTFVLNPLKELLEISEVFGLVVMDRKEATLGVLEGKNIRVLKRMTSGVPGKHRAGGQCLSPETLLMKDNGEIIKIKDSHNPLMILSENFNKEEAETTPLISKWENKKQLFKVTTCYPKIEIKSSADHCFFIRTEKGIEEKSLSEIKEKDYLIMPEKINLNLKDQEINFKPKIKQEFNLKKVNIPKEINQEFARILGYYLGDGSYEIDRLTFFEQRKEVAIYYKNLIEKVFGIEVKYLFRKDKNYHQLRIYSRIVSQLFKEIFPEEDKTLNERIPAIILKSSDKSLASFILGFFDAEGYVSEGKLALGINNGGLAKELQFSLLRLGIISSLLEYNNKRNPYSNEIRYTIEINDTESLKNFYNLANFNSIEKRDKLKKLIENRGNRNKVRQIIANGSEIARILRNSGIPTTQFRCPDFFINKKQLSKEVFKKNILDKIKDYDLKRRLETFYSSNLIAVKISKIEKLNEEITIDIETKSHNFLANGLIVHNSAQRFERLTEGMAVEFYRRVTAAMHQQFFSMPKLKGIIVGGPGPTKESMLEEGQLMTALKNKILAVKDVGYTDEFGLKMLIEAAQDILVKEEITKEKGAMKKFFTHLAIKPEKVAYGEAEVNRALDLGAVEILYLSKKLKKDQMHALEEKAIGTSTEVVLISDETDEGKQFLNLGGIGAILRYAIGD